MAEPAGLATDSAATEDPYANMRASKPWLELIKDAQKPYETYQAKCDNIDKLYADLKQLSGANTERQMQIFWANLEVLKPSIYARPPVPVVTGRFKDRKPLVRHASEILERCLVTSFDLEDINQTMLLLRDDLAVNARGVAWVRLEEDAEGNKRIAYDHIDRKDFCHDPARKWKEVGWGARKTYKTMEEMRLRFEEHSGNAYLSAKYEERKDDDGYAGEKKACVWEMWNKTKGVVVWFAEGPDEVLDIRPPFLNLEGFFPFPRPVYGTLERNSLKPVPDFLYCKDQLEEINELTARISALAEALKLKGFYSAGGEDVATAIETAMAATDNNAVLIPVHNAAAFGGNGTMQDAIVWMPVKEVAEVVTALVALRRQMIEDVYQVTGLSDIMRGSTDPNETLGAQQLKSQYGNIRIRDRQADLIRIARDMTRIAGEIMAEQFDPQTLMAMSQYDEVPTQAQVSQQVQAIKQKVQQAANDPQMVAQAQANPQIAEQFLSQTQAELQQLQGQVTFEQVVQFLKDERLRPFVLEIETDSTIQPDEDAAKQRTTEFLGALATALSQLAPMVQNQPQSAEFASEVLKFAVAPFRAGRQLEAAIDSFADKMKEVASQPKEDPEANKTEQEMALRKQEAENEQTARQQEMEFEREKHAMEMEKLRAELEALREKLAMERDRTVMKGLAEQHSTSMKMEAQRETTDATIAVAKAKQKQPERAGA